MKQHIAAVTSISVATETNSQCDDSTNIQAHQSTTLDHLREQSIYLEKMACAISSLGDVMGMMEYNLDVVTVTGLGELLKILGNNMLDTSLKEYDYSRAKKA